jgi:hypothetical protein
MDSRISCSLDFLAHSFCEFVRALFLYVVPILIAVFISGIVLIHQMWIAKLCQITSCALTVCLNTTSLNAGVVG